METCLGGRRNKQKQQLQKDQKQKSLQQTLPHHLLQQSPTHPGQKQLPLLQLNPPQPHHHHHHRFQGYQPQVQSHLYHYQPELQCHPTHLHPAQHSTMQQERHDTGNIAMYSGASGGQFGGSSSRHHQDSFSPPAAHVFPNFPPPPDFPPPSVQAVGTSSPQFIAKPPDGKGQFSGANTDGDSGGIGGDIADDGHNRWITAGHGLQHRYPDDLDAIEVCLEQEANTFQLGVISPVAATGRTFGSSRSSGNGVGGGNNCSMRNNFNQTNNTPTTSAMEAGKSQVKWAVSCNPEKLSQKMNSKSDINSIRPHQHMQQDYSYAYYEPGAAMRHSNIPPPEQLPVTRPPPPNSIRALLSKGKRNKLLVSPSTRQSYQTRYTAQENFYEEIASDDRVALLMSSGQSLVSINQTMVEEEFRRVQNHHRKILGELNLSVEAMLMPESASSGSPTEDDEEENVKDAGDVVELVDAVRPTDELLSPVSSTNPAFCGDLDSGFSGSSGASYIGSLRYHKTNAALSNLLNRKGKSSGMLNGSNTASAAGGSSFCSGSGSCRSSQRSFQEDSGQNSGSGIGRSYNTPSCSIKNIKGLKEKLEMISCAQNQPVQTESKARSFWNKKGWKKTPTSASTSNVHQASTDESKLNSGAWEDPLPIASAQVHTTITTAQLHSPPGVGRKTEHLNLRFLTHHHSKSCSGAIPTSLVNNSNSTATGPTHSADHRKLEHPTTARPLNSSEDSWCSTSDEENDREDEDDLSESLITAAATTTSQQHQHLQQQQQQQRNSQLRSTFNKAKQHLSFDKWRTSGSGGGNSGNQQQQQQQQQNFHHQNQSLSGVSSTTTTCNNSPQNSSTMPSAHHTHDSTTTPGESPGSRLSRWFSIRRGSLHQYDFGSGRGGDSRTSPLPAGGTDTTDAVMDSPILAHLGLTNSSTAIKMPELRENDDDSSIHSSSNFSLDRILHPGSRANGTNSTHLQLIMPSLPPAPAGLSQQQLKRRHIVAAIVHSENSYVATLQRLVNDYRKPLEESSPPILSNSKISTLFHRLPDILKSHKLFRIALADCIRNWDRDEKIGDVFVSAFSKPHVLDVYSGFINNFSAAMELAKMEAKRKSALADFFKVKQISAHDRLSFFGLMVKPVQRFPQFILFLQDILKYTPHGHHDRMSLQLALTQLESLAEMLNERKREAEQYQAFKEMLGHISGTFNTRSLTSSSSDGNRHRYLLREDNVTQLEFNQSGFIIKSKQRRLLLLNDKVICVSVAPKQSHDFGATEKLSFKWMYPVTDVEIVDNSTSATLSRILTAGLNRGGSLKSNSSSCGAESAAALTNGADNLCGEMSNLMHDYEVVSRVNDLVGSLKGKYKELNADVMRNLMNSIQSSIQKKDEEMAWVDSCCLQLIARNKSGKEETFTFQTENPSVKKEWITELRLAQLALDPNNSPGWEVPEHEQRPSTKMPLFVKAQPVYKSQHQTEVRCGCYYSITNDNRLGTARRRFKQQNYLWVSTSDGSSSHITVLSQHHQQAGSLKDVGSFDLVETQVTSMEFVKGLCNWTTKEEHCNLLGDLVWMGTDSRKILIYAATNPEQEEQLSHCSVSATITKILYHMDSVFVALSNASLLIYRRGFDGVWQLKEPQIVQLSPSLNAIHSILPINSCIYAGCGNKVYVLNALTGEVQRHFEVQHGSNQQVYLMAHSGVGLWVSLKNSSIICLYHTETFKHLQDINIAANVLRVKSSPKESINSSIYVTSLMACKGLLWVGTNVGFALTIPLPRLEGVPIISGGVNISFHAHFGPINLLLPLVPKSYNQKPPAPIETTTITVNDEPVTANHQVGKTENVNEDSESGVILRKNQEEHAEDAATAKRSLDKQNSLDLSLASKLRAQLASSPALRRRRFREMSDSSRASKTLPRGLGSSNFFQTSIHSNGSTLQHDHGYCDVYGLYGKLIFVKEDYDAEDGTQGNLFDFMYEQKRRSDPELAAIPGKVSTLDRRLRMKASRPRSLDLSNWSVDSRSSSLYTSSGSEESMGIRLFGGRSVSRNSSSASHKTCNGSDLGNISENGTIQVEVHNTNGSSAMDSSTPKHSSINPSGTGLSTANNIAQTSSGNSSKSSAPTVVGASNEMPSTITAATLKSKSKKTPANLSEVNAGPRTIITIMGGRGYWRHVWYTSSPSNTKAAANANGAMSRVANSNDSHIVVWEKKL